ncbi:MAG: hypothetical protein LAT66_06480 [Alkalimonas sp.]|nr:hypothetical protein [Alkalimonas sp.]
MDGRKRKRGVRASREKLEVAMLASGFETQAELAQQIAHNEGISKPPCDLVSKVFREQAVSPHNLTRIAHALQVEAHTIYLSKDDNPFTEVISSQSIEAETAQPYQAPLQNNMQVQRPTTQPRLTRRSMNNLWLALPALLILLASLIWWQQSNADHAPHQPPSTKLISPIGKVLIVLQAPANLHPLAEQIASQLSEKDTIRAIVLSRPETYQLPAAEVLNSWQAHGVLHLAHHEDQFYDAIAATLTSHQHSLTIDQSVFHHAEFTAQSEAIRDAIVTQSQRFIDGEPLAPILSNSSVALEHFLQGKSQLFSSLSASSYVLAESHFLKALELDTNFTAAHAELCRIYVRSSWIQDETPSLEKAASFCQLAAEQQPELLEVITAQAELLARTGRAKQALDLLNEHVTLTTADADALAIRATVHMARLGEDDPEPQGPLAEAYAKQAVQLVPGHWQANNSLGNLYFMLGDSQRAKAQFAKASQQHEVILANLGTLQMCYGELEQAEQTFQTLINHFDYEHFGHENLGNLYHMQQDYDKAIKHKLLAIEKHPEVAIHQVWSNLGELYLKQGQLDLAKQHYSHALTLIERDELLGNISRSDQLHKVYYQTKLQQLTPEASLPASLPQQVELFLADQTELGLHAKSHLAWLLGTVNKEEERQQLWQDISAICPVYALSPELRQQDQSISGEKRTTP